MLEESAGLECRPEQWDVARKAGNPQNLRQVAACAKSRWEEGEVLGGVGLGTWWEDTRQAAQSPLARLLLRMGEPMG